MKRLLIILLLPLFLLAEEGDNFHDLETIVVTEVVPLDEFVHRYDEIGELQFDAKEITKLPSVGEADISRALKYVPGVSGANENSSELIVHGGAPEQNLTLLDDIPIYSIDHFFGFFSPFSADAVEGVKLYKSFYPSWYGGRLSSVQDFTGRTGSYDTLQVGGNISMLSATAYLNIPIAKRASIFLSGRRSYSDLVETSLYEKIFNQFNAENDLQKDVSSYEMNRRPTFYFYDVNGKISVKASDKDSITATFYHGRDDLSTLASAHGYDKVMFHPTPDSWVPRAVDVKLENKGFWGNIGASGVWRHKWGESFKTKVVGGYSKYSFENDENFWTGSEIGYNIDSTDSAAFERQQSRFSETWISDAFGSVAATYYQGEHHTFDLGVEFKEMQTQFVQHESFTDLKSAQWGGEMKAYLDSASMRNIEQKEQLFSAWLQDKVTIGEKLTIVGGLRYSHYSGTETNSYSPRVSAVWNPHRLLSLRANWGLYYQHLTRAKMEDLYLEGDRYFWSLAGENSGTVSSANKTSAGISFKPGGFLIDVEGYYNKQDSLSMYKRSGTVSAKSFAVGESWARGFDVMVQKEIGIFTGWASYSLSNSIYQFGEEINSGEAFYSPYDHTHEVKLISMLNIQNFNCAATWIYATGSGYEIPVGTFRPGGIFSLNTAEFSLNGWHNSERLPEYHRLDVSASYKFTPGTKFGITIGGSVFNLYNRKNIRDYGFVHKLDSGGKDVIPQYIYRTESYYLGRVPSVFITIDFKQPLGKK